MNKRKAMTTEKARHVRQQGHFDAKEFAILIGKKTDYQNNPQAKKDVFDHSGDTYSVKSGVKRWQIFLYHKSKFEEDDIFQAMNGIGQLLIECLDIYPEKFNEYTNNKKYYKDKLRKPMRELCDKFKEKRRVRAFINKAMFDGGQVDYLAVKHDNNYHVFLKEDVIKTFSNYVEVSNSQARRKNETPEQKVLFKINGKNLAELEIRNSGTNHYKEVLFVMNKLKAINLLIEKIPLKNNFNNRVLVYGKASKKFGNWTKQ